VWLGDEVMDLSPSAPEPTSGAGLRLHRCTPEAGSGAKENQMTNPHSYLERLVHAASVVVAHAAGAKVGEDQLMLSILFLRNHFMSVLRDLADSEQ